MLRKFLSLIWATVLISQLSFLSIAQTATPTPNPLQAEVDEAEARAKIAKFKKEELEAKFPAPDAKALEASNDVKGELIEPRIQAYKAMEMISEEIAKKAQSEGISQLYIFREDDYAKIISYKKLIQQLDVISGEYEKCDPTRNDKEGFALGALTSIFLDWLPLLKTNTSIVGSDVVIEDEAVWASLGNSLSLKGISLGNPFVSTFDSTSLSGIVTGNLVQRLELAEYSSTHACTRPYPYKLQVDAAFTKLKNEILPPIVVPPPPTPQTKKTTTNTTAIPPTTTVIETVEQIPATSSSSTPVPFWDYLRTEKILTRMAADKIYWIKIKNAKSGGNMRVKSNPLIDIFRGGSSIKFSGGSIAYYYILDNDGKIKLSGVFYGYEPYTKSSRIR